MSNGCKSLKRAWAPKGRGGCATCRLRHIRCDGQTPKCTPCQKSFRQCEQSASKCSGVISLKVILWEPNHPAHQHVSSHPGYTSTELRAFDFFRTNIAPNLGGFHDSGFWCYDILQFAEREASVRHAIVALASLYEDNGKWSVGEFPDVPNSFAICQRSKAIARLTENPQGHEDSSPTVVLMTCILFIAYEMFAGNYEGALRHMTSGVYLSYDEQSKRGAQQSTTSNLPQHPDELTIQLQQLFGRLMMQTIFFVDTTPSKWRFLTPKFTPEFPFVPAEFESIDEVRNCLEGCLSAIFHRVLLDKLGGLEAERVDGEALQHWAVSFESFMTTKGGELPPRAGLVAILLEIQYTTGSILLSASAFAHESIFDSFESEFSRVVDLAFRLISQNNEIAKDTRTTCPSFDMGVLPHLYLVATRCRHPFIRRTALHLLQKGPSQEGIWNKKVLVAIAERIMMLEEATCEQVICSHDIAASARISVLNVKIHLEERTIALYCGRIKVRETGEMEVLREMLEY
jgi:hypothetical protein